MLFRGYQSVSFTRVASVHEHVPASTAARPRCSTGPRRKPVSSGVGASAIERKLPVPSPVRAMVPAQKASYGHFVRVLICDDEPDIRLLYRGAFEDAGVEVDEAGDGNEAIEVAGRVQPDIVVLDLYMPNRDGFSALAELRRLLPATRVIIVSAHAAVEVFDRGRA